MVIKMKEYKTYIFDLDYTLLIPDWSKEDEYLRKKVPMDEQEDFFNQKQVILSRYEHDFRRYNLKTLSQFFKKHGFNISEEAIHGWMVFNGENIKDIVADGVIDLFNLLKSHNKKIVVLTSWFSETQIPRLKRAGLFEYIDLVIAGDDAMKPHIEAFELARGDTEKEACLMVGDSIKSDKLGAKMAGIDYYIIDKDNSIKDLYKRIALTMKTK